MIRKDPSGFVLPGVTDQSVKLQTLRPIILSNIEHVGEFPVVKLSLDQLAHNFLVKGW